MSKYSGLPIGQLVALQSGKTGTALEEIQDEIARRNRARNSAIRELRSVHPTRDYSQLSDTEILEELRDLRDETDACMEEENLFGN